MKDDHRIIAVMDAECSLCSFGARMVHTLDRSGAIRIASVQSETGQALLTLHGLQTHDPESWLLVDQDVVYKNLDALAHLGRVTGGWGHVFRPLAWLPRPLRDAAYRLVARNRYRWFGRSSFCDLPDPELRARLLE